MILDTDDEDISLLVPPRPQPAAPVRKRKGPSVWQDPAATLEHEVPKDSRERAEDTPILGRKAESEALLNIMSNLSEERNLRELHLKHYHMSTAQFKKRMRHLDIYGIFDDLYQHVVKTCPFCNSIKTETGKISRERPSCRKNWRPHLS